MPFAVPGGRAAEQERLLVPTSQIRLNTTTLARRGTARGSWPSVPCAYAYTALAGT